REIPLPLERRRHPIETNLSRALDLRTLKRIEEKKLFVSFLIVEARKSNRAAEVESRRVDVKLRFREPAAVVLPRCGVPGITFAVVIDAARVIGRPALADDLDVRAATVA